MMADYIDRQAVIDKINERQRKLIYCFGFENDMVKIMDIARSIIIAMPSAEITEKDVREWCYRRGLIVIDNTVYHEMQHRWSASV